jgi:L-lactate dehydrogenase
MKLSCKQIPSVKVRPTLVRRPCHRIVAKASPKSIGVVGARDVGRAIVGSIIHKNIAKDIHVNDIDIEVSRGVVLDLEDEAFISGSTIHHAPSVVHLKNCDIIIITAGALQKPDEPIESTIQRNALLLRNILISLLPIKESAIILLVSNPVDILTSIVQDWCADFFPRNQIIGYGTYIETQRVRVAISKALGLSVKSVHAYILGEHGDSQVFAKSISRVGGSPLKNFTELSHYKLDELEIDAKRKAYEIIKRKGATSHSLGECVATICENIILDNNDVMSVTSYLPRYEVCLGWPVVIGANGVNKVIPLDVDTGDEARVSRSAERIKEISKDIVSRYPLRY